MGHGIFIFPAYSCYNPATLRTQQDLCVYQGQLENTETRERKREWERKRKTGTEITKRSGEREPVSWPYSRQQSQMSLN